MKDLFGTLLFISLIFLIIGLISPNISLFWLKSQRTRKKSLLIYLGGFIVFLICFGQFVETSNETISNSKSIAETSENVSKKTNDLKSETDTSNQRSQQNSNTEEETVQKEEKLADNDQWSQITSSNQIQGDWLQICWYYPNDVNRNYVENGDSEQKKLSLKKGVYQTSYPNGTGDNPKFAYSLKSNELIVTTQTKLASEIYRYQIKVNSEKKLLYLKEKDGLVQIFEKV
jgi:hypothetical protein